MRYFISHLALAPVSLIQIWSILIYTYIYTNIAYKKCILYYHQFDLFIKMVILLYLIPNTWKGMKGMNGMKWMSGIQNYLREKRKSSTVTARLLHNSLNCPSESFMWTLRPSCSTARSNSTANFQVVCAGQAYFNFNGRCNVWNMSS